ncbi:MAG: hypothetical protein H7Z74_08945 [Anaerolineae bacterium]|nr:hypothetical protein [Gemmatimonadaceae bacterium]
MSGELRKDVIVRRAADLRALGSRKAMQYQNARIGGEAEIVVTEGGPQPRGVTEDFLTVAVTDAKYTRGSRFRARLEAGDTGLRTKPLVSQT